LGNPSNAINLVSEPMIPAYDVEADKEISAVIKNLSSHLTMLNTNLKEMKEVRSWINRAEESLGEILRRLEGSKELDHVYGAEVV
jgi:DNA repair ATPase RecN